MLKEKCHEGANAAENSRAFKKCLILHSKNAVEDYYTNPIEEILLSKLSKENQVFYEIIPPFRKISKNGKVNINDVKKLLINKTTGFSSDEGEKIRHELLQGLQAMYKEDNNKMYQYEGTRIIICD